MQEPVTRRIYYQTKYFALDEMNIRSFWHFAPTKKHYILNIAGQKDYLKRQMMQKTKLGLKIGQLLYEQGLKLENLPENLFAKWRKSGEENTVLHYLQKKRLN